MNFGRRSAISLFVVAASIVTSMNADAAGRWDSCTSGPRDVRITAADGTRLVAHRFGTGRVAVVLVHQVDGTLCQWTTYGRRLARLGYTALAIDLRGFGQSQVVASAANNRYGGDVAAAANWLRAHGATKVFLVGASMGGSAVIDAAANLRRPAAGVISISGAAGMVNADAAVRRVRIPMLFLAAVDDTEFAADARTLYRLARSSRDKRLVIVANTGYHGVDLVANSGEARQLIESFLRSH